MLFVVHSADGAEEWDELTLMLCIIVDFRFGVLEIRIVLNCEDLTKRMQVQNTQTVGPGS